MRIHGHRPRPNGLDAGISGQPRRRLLHAALALCGAPLAQGQPTTGDAGDPGAAGSARGAGAGIARRADDLGIVINQTFTSSGQEFYRRFTDFWREKPDFETYTLVILERPSLRFGNRIIVSFGQTVVFAGNLPVKADAIRALCADAVEKAYANIIAASLRLNGERDPDMGRDEI